jgi:hypothetical protein
MTEETQASVLPGDIGIPGPECGPLEANLLSLGAASSPRCPPGGRRGTGVHLVSPSGGWTPRSPRLQLRRCVAVGGW